MGYEFSFKIVPALSGIFAEGKILDLDITVQTPEFDTTLEAATAVVEALLNAANTHYAENFPDRD
jgi:hypothetical protein